MNRLTRIIHAFWQWLDRVAGLATALIARLVTKRTVRVHETEPGRFMAASDETGIASNQVLFITGDNIANESTVAVLDALRGSRVEVLLRSDRFVFKPLELPSRAAEFLDGVVRAQIDRLTPWAAEQAAFGFSAPADAGSGRIVVTVAATAKMMLLPIVKAFSSLGAKSIALQVQEPQVAPDLPSITIMEDSANKALEIGWMRRILLAVLGTACGIAVTASVAAMIIDGKLRTRQDAVARSIAAERAAALSARNNRGDPQTLAERALAQRKNETASATITLEILSQILPDSTYVTELRIDKDRLRVTGITHDAPQLIRLIEQTRHFKDATFFAPITRSPSASGDRFNIEARMLPNFSVAP